MSYSQLVEYINQKERKRTIRQINLTRKNQQRTFYNLEPSHSKSLLLNRFTKPTSFRKSPYLPYIHLDQFTRDRVLFPQKVYQKGQQRCTAYSLVKIKMKDSRIQSFNEPIPPINKAQQDYLNRCRQMKISRKVQQQKRIIKQQDGRQKRRRIWSQRKDQKRFYPGFGCVRLLQGRE